MHIHLLLHGFDRILDTAFFSPLLGSFCADGEQAYCDKFTLEIMITGYGILAILLIIAATSCHQIPYHYEIFSRHLLSMYIIVVIQTFDMSAQGPS
jgi:hypothetical protein